MQVLENYDLYFNQQEDSGLLVIASKYTFRGSQVWVDGYQISMSY